MKPVTSPPITRQGWIQDLGRVGRFVRNFWDGSPPLGPRGKAPVGGLGAFGDKSPEAGNILQIICGRKQNSICQFTIIVGSFIQ